MRQTKKVPMPERNESKQDYRTPDNFIVPVQRRFGVLTVDLAATREDAQARAFVTPEEDSLSIDWVERFEGENCWLNPPYSHIAPWAAKCADFAARAKTGRILFLVPASVGANWYRDHVYNKAHVIALNGRITFVGMTTPYPKDCILCVFGAGIFGFEVWNWTQP